MSTKAITDAPGASRPPQGADLGPSVLRADDPGISRYVGALGALAVLFGGIVLITNLAFHKGPAISPGWSILIVAVGLVALLYHAAFDHDLQFRRVYMFFSYAAIVVGSGLCLAPYPDKMGDQFGPGFLCMSVGLVFLLAFLRNEDERMYREYGERVLLGVGAILLGVGLIGGNVNSDFLLGIGLLCCLLGLLAVTAYLSIRGVSDDVAYYVGLGLGGVGAVVFVTAFIRSAFYPGATGTYFIPNGLLLMVIAAVAGVISLGFCSDARFVVQTRREFGAFFYTPLAYFVLLAFTLAGEVNYGLWLFGMYRAAAPIPEPIVTNFVFGFLPVMVTIGSVPVLTMRLFSEEKRSGTLEVMLTTPVDEMMVVLSKFVAALFMFMLVWLPFALFLVSLRLIGGKSFDYRPMIAFGVVLVVTGAHFTSLGLLCSSLTRNQLVSGVLTFCAMTVLTCVWFVSGFVRAKWLHGLVDHVSYLDLWLNALQGKLILPELLFHATMAVLFLFITVKVMEARKWL